MTLYRTRASRVCARHLPGACTVERRRHGVLCMASVGQKLKKSDRAVYAAYSPVNDEDSVSTHIHGSTILSIYGSIVTSLAMCCAPPLDVDGGGGGLACGVAHGATPREEQLQRERRRGLGFLRAGAGARVRVSARVRARARARAGASVGSPATRVMASAWRRRARMRRA